ncbi:hypothetical protein BFW01_g6930 [Lasiodiplodia theobromae]|uniref:CHS4 chitin synthase CHS-4 n=1 Tax=Lasiodiplodia theobromae TaxID=45133 RepID=UPI0015C37D00|nr:CHS4 chitin synthase CHS-4 [Lasiodiplodia theobromae]KAF4537010.1 CHS4 chitin synthase CHS-4 [Lasiodiplodia theobromae]KAF9636035.1 hypothetical protein BFW01_g6930 [Lasiodiplodia theobromae]
MDMVISPGPISTIALWNDPDTGLSQHLGHCRKGRPSYLSVSFSRDRDEGSVHHICLNLHVPLDNAEQSFGITANFRAQYLGPIVTRSHHRAINYKQQPSKLSQTPEFIISQLDSFGSDGFKELVFMVHHPPEVLLFQVQTPDVWRVADVEAQKRISRMRSLSRAERLRLFIPMHRAASLDEIVQAANSVPVLEGRAFTSSLGYSADVEEKWKDWGVIIKDTTDNTGSADEKADLAKHEKRRRSADSEQQADIGKGRDPKRVKPDPNPQRSVPANTDKALFHVAEVESEGGAATSDSTTAGTSTLVMSTTSSCSETPSLGGTTFTRIAPTTELANKWAEWWEFMYGSLGVAKTDPVLVDSMLRMMQAVRNNDAEEFAAGVTDSALYSLNIDKKGDMEVEM